MIGCHGLVNHGSTKATKDPQDHKLVTHRQIQVNEPPKLQSRELISHKLVNCRPIEVNEQKRAGKKMRKPLLSNLDPLNTYSK